MPGSQCANCERQAAVFDKCTGGRLQKLTLSPLASASIFGGGAADLETARPDPSASMRAKTAPTATNDVKRMKTRHGAGAQVDHRAAATAGSTLSGDAPQAGGPPGIEHPMRLERPRRRGLRDGRGSPSADKTSPILIGRTRQSPRSRRILADEAREGQSVADGHEPAARVAGGSTGQSGFSAGSPCDAQDDGPDDLGPERGLDRRCACTVEVSADFADHARMKFALRRAKHAELEQRAPARGHRSSPAERRGLAPNLARCRRIFFDAGGFFASPEKPPQGHRRCFPMQP
jgi:hypothetical protein